MLKLSSKLALGVTFVGFLLNYQPEALIPPFQKNTVLAQTEQNQTVTSQALPVEFQIPHPGYVSTRFSSYHPGIDLASGLGIPVKPVAAGIVIDAGFNFFGLGLSITIDHGYGYRSVYGHLGKLYVQAGQKVQTSDFIGEVGLTGHTSGPHTHIEIAKEGTNINPLTVLPKIREVPQEEDFQAYGGQTNTFQTPFQPTAKPIPTLAPKSEGIVATPTLSNVLGKDTKGSSVAPPQPDLVKKILGI